MNYSTITGNGSGLTGSSTTIRSFVKAASALFFFLFIIQVGVKAQAPPSCNLGGPLQAKVRGANIVVTVQVANSTATPQLAYSLKNNPSGASIVSKAAPVYNSASNSLTQQVTIAPGSAVGGFNLQLLVTTPNGTCQCSKSVTVAN